jgi:hypothetical protein
MAQIYPLRNLGRAHGLSGSGLWTTADERFTVSRPSRVERLWTLHAYPGSPTFDDDAACLASAGVNLGQITFETRRAALAALALAVSAAPRSGTLLAQLGGCS